MSFLSQVFVLAQSQQDAVINAIRNSSSAPTPQWLIWTLFGVSAAGIGTVVVVQRLRSRRPVESARKVVRNSKKRVKEVGDDLGLSAAEMRKLEHHAERMGMENPLTLLLCPSLVEKKGE